MKISVLTPSLNSGKFIERAIKSVLVQDFNNWEHIIMDGGSTDNTLDIIKKYPHLIYCSEPDQGQSDAMNKAFKLSTGDIIVYLNADDWFEDDVFTTVVKHFENGHKFVVGNINVVDENGKLLFINKPKVTFEEMIFWWKSNSFPFNPLGYFYTREVQLTNPFNIENSLTMDVEFLLDVASNYKFHKIDKVMGCFSLMPGTKTYDTKDENPYYKFVKKYFRTRKYKYLKSRYYFEFKKYQISNNIIFYKRNIIMMIKSIFVKIRCIS